MSSNIERSALLPYPAEKIYTLINDVTAYRQFMDGCVGVEVLKQSDTMMEARLDLAKAGIRQSFTTRNTLQPPHTIKMELVEGPFEYFQGCWKVLPLNEQACKVSLALEFKLSNKVMAVAAKTLFSSQALADNLVDATIKRAHQLFKGAPGGGV